MAKRTPQQQLLHDITIRFQVYLERLKAGQIKHMDDAIRKLDRAIVAAMNAMPDAPSQARINKLLRELRGKMETINERELATYMDTLERFHDYALEFNASTLGAIMPPNGPAIADPDAIAAWAATLEAPIHATGTLLEPFIETWGESAIKKVEGAIRVGYSQGQTTGDIVRSIRGTKANNFRDGILGNATKREADAMVRTSLQQVSSQARSSVFAENADIIDGEQWISTLDDRTTEQCMALDGRVFPLGEGPRPPIHVNCRSATIPVLRKIGGIDFSEGRTRASADGQVDARQTYFDWLKGQSASFQDDALGPTRGQLFRDGGLSSKQFADLLLGKNFEPLTLEEMEEKNPAAFKRADID